VIDQLHAPRPLYPRVKCLRHPLSRKWGGPQSRSGRCGGMTILPLSRIELRSRSRQGTTHDNFEKIIVTARLPLLSSDQSSWLHNGDVLWFLWGTNWIYICYVEESRPPLWSSGQSSWLQIQRSGLDYRHYQIFWEVMGNGVHSASCTWKKSSGSGLESREYGQGIRHADHVAKSIRRSLH
jgi:hypothetical protein